MREQLSRDVGRERARRGRQPARASPGPGDRPNGPQRIRGASRDLPRSYLPRRGQLIIAPPPWRERPPHGGRASALQLLALVRRRASTRGLPSSRRRSRPTSACASGTGPRARARSTGTRTGRSSRTSSRPRVAARRRGAEASPHPLSARGPRGSTRAPFERVATERRCASRAMGAAR